MSEQITIYTNGLEEVIRCAICKNPIKSESGCDGSCQYDKELHAKIVEAVTGLAEQKINIAKFSQEAYENGKKDGYIQGKIEKGNEWDCLPDKCTGRVKLKEFYKDGKLVGVANCMGCEYFHFVFGNCYNMYGYACSRDTCKFEDTIKRYLDERE